MENISYKRGRPAFNKLVIKLSEPIYCAFKRASMHLKIKKQNGKIPPKGGLLIASHHEDDADPIVIKTVIKRRLNWIAATKLFGKSILNNKFLKKIWDMWGIITIDRENYKRNKWLFDYVTYLLEIGEAVIIFPEGNLMIERENKRFGKAKDGVIRIAQFAQRKIGRKIPIYPIGIKYKKKSRIKEAFIRIGDPFFVGDNENPKKAIATLMKKIVILSNIK